NEEEEKQIAKEQAAKARYWKILICYDDDEDCSIAITPKEPDNYLSMVDEHLDTIPATKSDEFIKSSVENLVPSPITTSRFMMKTSRKKSIRTFFLMKNYFYEDIDPHHFNAESGLIESLLKHDFMIISSSSKIDSLLDEFTGELTLLKSIPPGINETDCDPEEEIRLIKKLLYDNSSPRPPENFIFENSDTVMKSFSPSHIPVEDSDSFMEEIYLSFTSDDPMPLDIEEDDYDPERGILILEELVSNNFLSLPENESFHFDIPSSSRPSAKPPDGNSEILNVHKASYPSTECPMMIYERNTPILDVPFLHFYPP
nr:hypothetical protein [Tanacetum cinerariifolium]